MPITTTAREALDAMYEFMAAELGQDPRNMVNIDPEKAQTIETKLMQDNAFLSQINNQPVDAVAGEVLAFGVPNTITKRTNTAQGDGSLRRPADPTSLVARQYYCRELEQDALMTWKKIDRWAHVADFYAKFRESVRFARQRDMLMIMWNGQKATLNTDPLTYPLLQDMGRGFIQYMIDEYPDNVLGIKPSNSEPLGYSIEPIRIGPGAGDNGFENIDLAVNFLKETSIHRLFRRRKSQRVLIGDDLLIKDRAQLMGVPNTKPTERVATQLMLKNTQVGQVERAESDELPPHLIFVSELSNFSHYWLESSIRTKYDENHDKKGVVNYYYKECDNVMEVAEAAALFHPDAIEVPTGYDSDGNATGWAAHNEVWKIQ